MESVREKFVGVLPPAFCAALAKTMTPLFTEAQPLHLKLDQVPVDVVDDLFKRLAASPIMPRLFDALGPSLYFTPDNSLFRRVTGDRETHIPFHQDATFMGGDFVSVNCWIPLRACRDNVPGLDLMSAPLTSVLPARDSATTPTASHFGYRAPATFEGFVALYADLLPSDTRLWEPDCEAGDVLMFDHYVLHRCRPSRGFDGDRIALEVRCMSLVDGLARYRGASSDAIVVVQDAGGPVVRRIRKL